jgi:cytochrome c551/c552
MKYFINITLLLISILFLGSFTLNTSNKYNRYSTPVTPNIDGKKIFKSNGCTTCHTNSENSIGPKIRIIANAYQGKKEQLIKFLNREAKPIVVPEEFAMMNAFLLSTKRMSNDERTALAEYILTNK